jgi:hypothetical protein
MIEEEENENKTIINSLSQYQRNYKVDSLIKKNSDKAS